MDLYIAGLYASHFEVCGTLFQRCPPHGKALRLDIKNSLESYHYIKSGRYCEKIRKDGIRVFLDSGAFSAFSLGVEVDIEAYADFVRENKDIIKMASVLDAIGDPVGTFNNQKTLERLGAEVLPCFHYGEPWDLCDYYARNYEYMTVGGMVPIPNNKLEYWLDELWSKVLTDKDGFARTKVHGFGLTSRKLMDKYPWFSVDSSSWVQAAANGSIVLPEIPSAIPVSDRSPMKHKFSGHIDSFNQYSRDYIESLLHHYGCTLEEVQTNYIMRWALNAFTYNKLGELFGEDHWRRKFSTQLQTLF